MGVSQEAQRAMLLAGSADPPPQQTALRAGPLQMQFAQGDLRDVALDGEVILRRVMVAVRDQNWGTVAPRLAGLRVRATPDRFWVRYQARSRSGPLDFAWRGEFHGAADGTLTCTLDGVTRSTFWKNRIGICALLPAALAGRPVEVERADGTNLRSRFPTALVAHQPAPPFAALGALRFKAAGGWQVELRFSGDLFEMEDQRLWSDASYKVYSTPLALPYPVEIQAGTRILQALALRITPPAKTRQPRAARAAHAAEEVSLEARAGWQPLPALGLSAASHGLPLTGDEIARLRALRLDHLRAEIDFTHPGAGERLEQAASESVALGAPLLLALPLDPQTAQGALDALRGALEDLQPALRGWLVFPAREPYAGGSPGREIARLAWDSLKPHDPALPLAVGTNTDYIFLKRTTLPLAHMDQVCVTLHPQAHAFDHQSLIETLSIQPLIIDATRRQAGGQPVVVSPVTLKPRFNPYAAGAQPEPLPGALPAQVDPRQMSLFGAGWTLGSLRSMVAGGAERVTYYETTGWRGVIEQAGGPPLPALFTSIPGGVYPLYHALVWYSDFAGGDGLPLTSSHPMVANGLALRRSGRAGILLANHTSQPQAIAIDGMPGIYRATRLDESALPAALRDPLALESSAERTQANADGTLRIELAPYALTRLLAE